MTTRRLVLGIGSGRSGSLSLAVLLNRHPEAAISHELRPLLEGEVLGKRESDPPPWAASVDEVIPTVRLMLGRPASVVGDVASYWLPHVEPILGEYPSTRVVCLRRPRDETIESFMRKTGDKNHWMEHDGSHWRREPLWDACFPKYEASGKEEAIGLYWDDYYARADDLAERFPENVRVWDMRTALDTRAGVEEMLSYVGLETPTASAGINRNRSERRLGTYARMLWVRLSQRR